MWVRKWKEPLRFFSMAFCVLWRKNVSLTRDTHVLSIFLPRKLGNLINKILWVMTIVVLVFPRKDRWNDSAVFLHAQKSSQSDGRKARRWSGGSCEAFCSVPSQIVSLVWSRSVCDRKKGKKTYCFKNLGMHKIYIHNWRNGGGVVLFKKKVKLYINTL